MQHSGASLEAQQQRTHLPVQGTEETQVRSLGQEDPLEKEMAPCFSILAWEIAQTEEPGGLQSMRPQRVGHDSATKQQAMQWGQKRETVMIFSECCLPVLLGFYLLAIFVLAVQFEGSLGKLTVSSVNNPRKMIDAVVTSRSEDDVSSRRIVCLRKSESALLLWRSLGWNPKAARQDLGWQEPLNWVTLATNSISCLFQFLKLSFSVCLRFSYDIFIFHRILQYLLLICEFS